MHPRPRNKQQTLTYGLYVTSHSVIPIGVNAEGILKTTIKGQRGACSKTMQEHGKAVFKKTPRALPRLLDSQCRAIPLSLGASRNGCRQKSTGPGLARVRVRAHLDVRSAKCGAVPRELTLMRAGLARWGTRSTTRPRSDSPPCLASPQVIAIHGI